MLEYLKNLLAVYALVILGCEVSGWVYGAGFGGFVTGLLTLPLFPFCFLFTAAYMTYRTSK